MTTKPDVPGTYVFDIADSRHGHAINELCSTLTTPAHRARFLADEADYCDHFDMTPAQRTAVLQRDWRSLLDLGGSIFHVLKLATVDKLSMQHLGGVFTGMTTEDFIAAMRAGGRRCG
ncbi:MULTISPECIES: protocatechuate 3,4-dioxygenase [Streptomyces]|uniref:Protocatechuate 3,4-dioxygenase n=2 Tax=Streptomyces griseoaurantiacus TaxID=68213 RepID=A0A7W2DTW3_9ACTN|nr:MULTISPECIES: protocatechuate 3,4-dioxygenase [Streptomyces]MBA5222931.1 protocatechuate 3,4-dioxygenase [Streptomyces griseoaurantiacus]MCF0085343.1 Protocatechuate 4,5-dioxygenase alpha chain [Streptomyces sp. MH192]MCF0098182.1 Protocatechuate 4,5-dioxygenase alpha chain [Streptomyces sp. MH191]MDX3088087.1 protocatechuate 3,4-dioxygenase [Streptomyces sp. ME12-02E]MDX3331443.1 protocatechuate 3,4-dioxygenase [Streptomyces sp. ME02-6978a]